jgi:hypothetical protein
MEKALTLFLSGSVLLSGVVGCATPGPKVDSGRGQTSTATALTDARILYEMGKLDLAEQKLHVVLQTGPENPAAGYLLSLVHEAQYRREAGQERPWGYYQTIPQQPIYR